MTFGILEIASLVVAVGVLGFWLWSNRQVMATKCGHLTYRSAGKRVFGHDVILEAPLEHGKPCYCLDCIAKMSIRCTWCGGPILLGDPITLYSASEKVVVPDYAVSYQENKHDTYRRYVGCLRSNCADTGAVQSGYWAPPGKVERIPTAYEELMGAGTGTVVTLR